jgi:hypothetical protein
MRTVFAASGTALLVAVALQGCGSDASPSAEPGKDRTTPAAEAFARYVAPVVQYSTRARDVGSLTTVAGPMVYPRISFVDRRGEQQSFQKTSDYRLSVDQVRDAQGQRWQVKDFTFAIVKATS